MASEWVNSAPRRELAGFPAATRSLERRIAAFGAPLRASFEIIGLVCVAFGIMLACMPDVRAPLLHTSGALWSTLGESFESAVPALGPARERAGVAEELGRRVELSNAQSHVALYLARRYRVADGAVRVLVATAERAGREHQVDPLLILAVVAVESSMNPLAQSPVGATGLMQVMPQAHEEEFVATDGGVRALDPIDNIRVGSRILADVIRRGGSIERGLQLYVGAGNLADDGGYVVRVLAEMGRLRQAAAGDVAAALAAGLRGDTHAVPDSEPAASAVEALGRKARPA